MAAGYTTWISYIIFAYANYIAMKKVFTKRNLIDDLYDYKSLIVIIVAFTILSLIGVILYDFILIRILCALAVCLVALINRKKLLGIYNDFRKR